jgi:hypothetical protein
MFKDLMLVIKVIRIKRKLNKIEKRLDAIGETLCDSDHKIDEMIDILEELNGR